MKKYTLAITTSVIMLLLIGGIVTYAVVSSNSEKPKRAGIASQKAISTDGQQLKIGNGSKTTQPTANEQTLGVSNAQGTSMGLQSNLGQANSTPSNSAASLPGPDTFLQYEQYKDGTSALFADVVVGKGDEAAQGATVAMIYSGWLTNGTLFDKSRMNDQGQVEAFSFELGAGKVIAGWDQGITGMKVGGKRRLIIPPAVGYGESGQGIIPPNALLVFDVELVAVQ